MKYGPKSPNTVPDVNFPERQHQDGRRFDIPTVRYDYGDGNVRTPGEQNAFQDGYNVASLAAESSLENIEFHLKLSQRANHILGWMFAAAVAGCIALLYWKGC